MLNRNEQQIAIMELNMNLAMLGVGYRTPKNEEDEKKMSGLFFICLKKVFILKNENKF